MEAALLRRARGLLARAPNEALSLTQEHLARFSTGELGEERERIAMEALLLLGRRPEAHARRERFLQEHSSSVHKPSLERLLSDPE